MTGTGANISSDILCRNIIYEQLYAGFENPPSLTMTRALPIGNLTIELLGWEGKYILIYVRSSADVHWQSLVPSGLKPLYYSPLPCHKVLIINRDNIGTLPVLRARRQVSTLKHASRCSLYGQDGKGFSRPTYAYCAPYAHKTQLTMHPLLLLCQMVIQVGVNIECKMS